MAKRWVVFCRGCSEKGKFGGFAGGLPDLDDLVDDDGAVGDREPYQDGFNGEVGPGADEEAGHLALLVAPPAVGDGEGGLPEHADEQDHEQRKREGAPVDEAARGGKEGDRWDEAADDEDGEVFGEAIG